MYVFRLYNKSYKRVIFRIINRWHFFFFVISADEQKLTVSVATGRNKRLLAIIKSVYYCTCSYRPRHFYRIRIDFTEFVCRFILRNKLSVGFICVARYIYIYVYVYCVWHLCFAVVGQVVPLITRENSVFVYIYILQSVHDVQF